MPLVEMFSSLNTSSLSSISSINSHEDTEESISLSFSDSTSSLLSILHHQNTFSEKREVSTSCEFENKRKDTKFVNNFSVTPYNQKLSALTIENDFSHPTKSSDKIKSSRKSEVDRHPLYGNVIHRNNSNINSSKNNKAINKKNKKKKKNPKTWAAWAAEKMKDDLDKKEKLKDEKKKEKEEKEKMEKKKEERKKKFEEVFQERIKIWNRKQTETRKKNDETDKRVETFPNNFHNKSAAEISENFKIWLDNKKKETRKKKKMENDKKEKERMKSEKRRSLAQESFNKWCVQFDADYKGSGSSQATKKLISSRNFLEYPLPSYYNPEKWIHE